MGRARHWNGKASVDEEASAAPDVPLPLRQHRQLLPAQLPARRADGAEAGEIDAGRQAVAVHAEIPSGSVPARTGGQVAAEGVQPELSVRGIGGEVQAEGLAPPHGHGAQEAAAQAGEAGPGRGDGGGRGGPAVRGRGADAGAGAGAGA